MKVDENALNAAVKYVTDERNKGNSFMAHFGVQQVIEAYETEKAMQHELMDDMRQSLIDAWYAIWPHTQISMKMINALAIAAISAMRQRM